MKKILSSSLFIGVGVVLLCAHAIYSRASLPSDAALTAQFFAHRAQFDQLLRMAQQDKHLVRIAPNFTWLDTDASWPRKNPGISPERWKEYRHLFVSAGVPDGISKGVKPSVVLFLVAAQGLVPSGREKGIAYSPATLGPVVESLDRRPPRSLYADGHVMAFKAFTPHWYLYYQEW